MKSITTYNVLVNFAPDKFVDISTFSGTINNVIELPNSAGFLLVVDKNITFKTTNVVRLFGNNLTGERIIQVGYKLYNNELKELLENV